MKSESVDPDKLRGMVVAIDGPAGSGKSTTARMLAQRLAFCYLDTGAMYRSLTYFALSHDIPLDDHEQLSHHAAELDIKLTTVAGVDRVFIGEEDVSVVIRKPNVTAAVSEVAAHPGVRLAMVSKQRELGRKGSIVAEGRDTTTVVFPDADVKVYLTADVTRRAERRLKDMDAMGVETSVEEEASAIERRDKYDSGREHSPLKQAADAELIDTSSLTPDEQVQKIVDLVVARAAER